VPLLLTKDVAEGVAEVALVSHRHDVRRGESDARGPSELERDLDAPRPLGGRASVAGTRGGAGRR
jgi:hypothetical protein